MKSGAEAKAKGGPVYTMYMLYNINKYKYDNTESGTTRMVQLLNTIASLLLNHGHPHDLWRHKEAVPQRAVLTTTVPYIWLCELREL